MFGCYAGSEYFLLHVICKYAPAAACRKKAEAFQLSRLALTLVRMEKRSPRGVLFLFCRTVLHPGISSFPLEKSMKQALADKLLEPPSHPVQPVL